MSAEGDVVRLFLYDVSRGLAEKLSPVLLGRQVDGLWHSTVVVDDTEYSYGPPLRRSAPGQGPLGHPHKVLELGITAVPGAVRDDIVAGLARRYDQRRYDLLFNNCNSFAAELGELLTGTPLPEEVTHQAKVWLENPLGERVMAAYGAGAGVTPAAGHGNATGAADAANDGCETPGTSAAAEQAAAAAAATAAAASPPDAAMAAARAELEAYLRDVACSVLGMDMGPAGMFMRHGAFHSLMSLLEEAVQAIGGGANMGSTETHPHANNPAHADGNPTTGGGGASGSAPHTPRAADGPPKDSTQTYHGGVGGGSQQQKNRCCPGRGAPCYTGYSGWGCDSGNGGGCGGRGRWRHPAMPCGAASGLLGCGYRRFPACMGLMPHHMPPVLVALVMPPAMMSPWGQPCMADITAFTNMSVDMMDGMGGMPGAWRVPPFASGGFCGDFGDGDSNAGRAGGSSCGWAAGPCGATQRRCGMPAGKPTAAAASAGAGGAPAAAASGGPPASGSAAAASPVPPPAPAAGTVDGAAAGADGVATAAAGPSVGAEDLPQEGEDGVVTDCNDAAAAAAAAAGATSVQQPHGA